MNLDLVIVSEGDESEAGSASRFRWRVRVATSGHNSECLKVRKTRALPHTASQAWRVADKRHGGNGWLLFQGSFYTVRRAAVDHCAWYSPLD